MKSLKCPNCGNTDTFYRAYKAQEKIWTDEEGRVAGYKDEETLEVLEITCANCETTGTPEQFGYEG
jgi:hypothetical protein